MGLWQILNEYGEEILKAVGYEGCKRWYGPVFVEWYNKNHVFGKQ